jgi:hypothetical protein
MSQIPPIQSSGSIATRPHRAGTVLTLGIVGLVLTLGCGLGWILGIVAWVMGNADLRQMDAGTMDPSGRGNTQAGKICGIISVALAALGLVIYLFMVLVMGAAMFGAATGGGLNPPPGATP